MNKKFISAVVTAFACAACALSFSACGNNPFDIPKGEMVADEAAWKAAFEANLNAENITVKENYYYKKTATFEKDGNTITEVTDQTEILSAYINDGGMYASYKLERHTSGEGESIGVPEIFEEYKSYSLHELGEWENNLAPSDYYNFKTTDDWTTIEATPQVGYYMLSSNYRGNRVYLCEKNSYDSYLLKYKYTMEPREGVNAEWTNSLKNLSDLYSAFTYSEGLYTAELYSVDFNDLITVKISIKDGIVVGLLIEDTCKLDNDKYSITLNGTISFKYSDIGNTSYTLPQKLQDAIETERNNNN